jgi:putative two-component system response regulator
MFAVDDIQIRILIVDDEPQIREILSSFLCEDYECQQAESAECALNLIRQTDFAVVVTDVQMRGIRGLDLIPLIKRESPQTIVIVITGHQSTEDAVCALRAGAFDYIAKPFDLLQIEAAVRRAVEHYELTIIKKRYDLHLEQLVSERTTELDNTLEALENSYRATLKALVQALETRDFETHGHSERVVTFSLRLGFELSLPENELRALEYGALLHDIGKIGVPDAILRKPGALTQDEWQKMRLHPTHGEQILRDIPFLEGATKVVAQHHEKWDGSGYPQGLRGEEIDIKARIFSVVDAFDAIISERVYKCGKTYEEACAELKRVSGKQFDPNIIDAFLRIPKQDWEILRRVSLVRKVEKFSFQSIVSDVIDKRINPNFQTELIDTTSSELALEQR